MTIRLTTAAPSLIFDVEQQITDLGGWAWVGRRIEFKRRPTGRQWFAVTTTKFENYIVTDMTGDQFHNAKHIKGLHTANMLEVKGGDVLNIRATIKRVDREYQEGLRVAENMEKDEIIAFKKGQALDIVDGPFAGLQARYLHMTGGNPYRKVGVIIEGMGASEVSLDPMQVRAAE